MARPKEGYELLQVTVSRQVGRWVRVLSAAEGCPAGQFVEKAIREYLATLPVVLRELKVLDPISGELGTRTQLTPFMGSSRPDTPTKAPGRAQEAMKATRATTASDEARADLWLLLESTREAEGWTDGKIAEALGIAARNVSQWRKAGMVTSTQVEAVEKLLHKAKH